MADKEIKVPDIGGAAEVDVIEILVKEGDEVAKDSPLITLESDKASMEIPSSAAGKIKTIKVKIGDKISEGDVILLMSSADNEEDDSTSKTAEPIAITSEPEPEAEPELKQDEKMTALPAEDSREDLKQETAIRNNEKMNVFAGPAVRRLARELGVNLEEVPGSGHKSRISKEDVQRFVKNKIQNGNTGGFYLPSAPTIDFTKFGEINIQPLNKIKRLTGANVHRAWVTIPHVTQFDEADITDLEVLRKSELERNKEVKLTLLAFVCKVVSQALKTFPQFNTSLDNSGENLIYKQYYNIGVAVETPNGLVVPVLKEVDKLSVTEIAKEMTRLSIKAREKGLMPADMSGGCFTISSLGGIGGTAFTPIVNSPEVAILGLSRSQIKPIYSNGEFKPRLMLPLSLSYDHRVIDGAEAARFTRYISECLSDLRKILI